MKKLLALFLLLAMLVPMCVVAQAEEVADKPFYLVNMSRADTIETSYFYTMPIFFGMHVDQENPELRLLYKPTIAEKAASLKKQLDAQPEGTRYMFLEALRVVFFDMVEDGIYMEDAVEVTKRWVDAFFKEYKAIGGQFDGLVIDLEYEPAKYWFIFERLYKNDEKIYNKIADNPKYQTLIRPHLVERGFKFYEGANDVVSELYCLHPNSGDEYASSRGIWDVVARDLMNQYVNQACEPLFTYYPDAVLTDYQSGNTYAWLKMMEHSGGMGGYSGNIVHTVGNRSSEDTYSNRPSLSFYKDLKNVSGYNNAVYENTPYSHFLMDANLFKTTAAAAKDGKVSYWITDWRYNVEDPNAVSRTPYYTETILHLAMLDPDPMLGYVIPSEICGTSNPEDPDYLHAVEIVDDILTELTRVLGKADRKPIPTYDDWNSKFVVSGMYAGGKNYWRVTPDTTVVSLENFKVEGTDPTFSAAGKTITFPGGKIIADGDVREIGTCGYWVETAADVSPVISVVEDYYYQYPAFAETFDGYADGIDFDGTTAVPADAWTVKKSSKSSATIKNGALELMGKFSINNVNAPALINAVDVYAKHQGIEVDVTVPADMAADAEIVLFNVLGKKTKSQDIGMKIAGGKLYYDNAGAYVELADVTPGTTYKVRRELNMTVDNAFTGAYYLYDSTGALLASVKDVSLTPLVAPITSISMSCNNIAGEPVILDNYKVFVIDANTNFELYDAVSGVRAKDVTAARDKDTAYRFTWLNATSKERSYSVIAAFYNGEQLVSEQVVKEVKAAPNTDGVVTGIVKLENAGQTMKIYLKDNTPADDNGGADGKKIDWLLIGGAVVIVLVIGELVFLFVSMNKKKKKAAKKTAQKAPKAEKPAEE